MKRILFMLAPTFILCLHSGPAWSGRLAEVISVCGAPGDQIVVGMASDGAGGALVTWIDERRGVDSADVYVQRITGDGTVAEGWPADGAAVCDAAGEQFVGGIVGDGLGGAILAWDDGRVSKDRDIYAGRVGADASTPPGWQSDGVQLNGEGPEIKSGVVIAGDGAGGVFVAWNDYSDRPTQSDVYAQHILVSGVVDPAWGEGGIIVCDELGFQLVEAAVADGEGGFYLVWDDRRPPLDGGHMYAQHVTGTGVPVEGWPAGGRIVCPNPGTQAQVQAVADGRGGVLLAWRDFRDDLNGDIYATRILQEDIDEGWPTTGRPVRNDIPGWIQSDPVVAPDGLGGLLIAYAEIPSEDFLLPNVAMQHLDPFGRTASGWSEEPRAIGRASVARGAPRLAQDGDGGTIVVWTEPGDPYSALRAVRIHADGSLAAGWSEDGVLLARRREFVYVPPILADGDGGAWIVWSDRDAGEVDMGMQHVTSAGIVLGDVGFDPSSGPLVIYPNPVAGAVTVLLDLPFFERISAEAYDASGRRIRTFPDRRANAFAPLTLTWDGNDEQGRRAAAGVYLLRLVAGGKSYSGRVIIVR
jgi:hypothetical protein